MPRFHAPVDPDCPVVSKFNEQLNNPEDHIVGAPYDDVVQSFENKHRSSCERCIEYGCANIEVE